MDDNTVIEGKIKAGIFQLVQKRESKSPIWIIFSQKYLNTMENSHPI